MQILGHIEGAMWCSESSIQVVENWHFVESCYVKEMELRETMVGRRGESLSLLV